MVKLRQFLERHKNDDRVGLGLEEGLVGEGIKAEGVDEEISVEAVDFRVEALVRQHQEHRLVPPVNMALDKTMFTFVGWLAPKGSGNIKC